MPILRKISLKHLLMCKSILVHLAWFIQSLSHLLRVAKYTYWVAFLFVDSYVLDAATSSGILKAKQKLGRTFNSDKLAGIAFTKISKLTMCSA